MVGHAIKYRQRIFAEPRVIAVNIEQQLGTFHLNVVFSSAAKVIALFGRSGCGKTSVVNAIAGVSRPKRGRIQIGDTVVFDAEAGIFLPPEARRVGYVFQDGLLFPHMNVAQNLRYGQGRQDVGSSRAGVSLSKVVDVLGLNLLLARRPINLSGGERQRVAIGRALLANPQLLLLDEPLAALDNERKQDVMQYIERLRDEFAIPMVLVSHSHDEVTRLAQEMVLMVDGRVVETGIVDAMMSRLDLTPLSGRYEAGAVIRATIASHDDKYALTTLTFAGGTLRVPRINGAIGNPAHARVRARDVSVALSAPSDISINNILQGIVREISHAPGPIVDLQIAVGEALLLARITRYSVDKLNLAPGTPVYLLLKAISLDKQSLAHR